MSLRTSEHKIMVEWYYCPLGSLVFELLHGRYPLERNVIYSLLKHISRPTRTPWISAEPECLSFISYLVCTFIKYLLNLTSTDADSLSFVIWMSSLAIKRAVSLYVVIALSSLFTSFFTIKSSSQLLYLFKHPFYVTLITCSLFFCSFIPLVVRLGLSFSPCHTSMHLTAILLGY